MPKNLRGKLNTILEDTERLSKHERLNLLEELIDTELGFLEAEHALSSYDLTTIQSVAVNYMQDLDVEFLQNTSPSQQRAICYVESVIGFLRREGLISFKFKYKK